MTCPICKKEMLIKTEDTSHNSINEKEYSRIIYWCEADDTWVTVEIPKK
jgi:hypothetical protein